MSGLDLPVTPRVPPHNLEAEIAVLGSVLMEVETLDGPAMSLLQPETFYREGHRKIFAAQLELRARGFTPDLVTIAEELMRAGKLDEVGGMTYLIGIGQQTPTSAHAERYAAIVREKWVLRQLISQCGRMMQTAYEAQMPLEDMLGKAAQIGQGLETQLDQGVYDLSDELGAYVSLLHSGEGVTPLSTGLKDLDRKLGGGLFPQTLNILAARPSMGKSALMLNIAESVGAYLARTGEKGQVAIVSLEMPRQSLVARMVATRGRINSGILRSAAKGERPLDESQSDRVMRAAAYLDRTPIKLLDDPAADTNIRILANKLRRMHREAPLRLVVVDYLQLMSTGQENRQQEVSAVSRALKGLARELDCAFLVLSQLSRKVEERPNRRPMLSDLRESGGIEQDADVIMFIYRDEYYHPETDKHGIAEIIVGKQRDGEVGTVEVQFQSTHVGFADLAYAQGGGT